MESENWKHSDQGFWLITQTRFKTVIISFFIWNDYKILDVVQLKIYIRLALSILFRKRMWKMEVHTAKKWEACIAKKWATLVLVAALPLVLDPPYTRTWMHFFPQLSVLIKKDFQALRVIPMLSRTLILMFSKTSRTLPSYRPLLKISSTPLQLVHTADLIPR